MRLFLAFLIFVLCGQYCSAEELVLGRVVSIDQEKGTVAMEVVDGPADLRADSGEKQKVITLERSVLPTDTRVNSLVRMWGTVDKRTSRFIAAKTHVSDGGGSGQGGRSGIQGAGSQDATGVRNRLGKGSAGSGRSGGSGYGGAGNRGGAGGSGAGGRGGGLGGQGGR